MKILMVSSYLPYPLHSGGHVRLYNLIKELPKNHEITLICEKRPIQTEKDVIEVEKICKKVITVERRKQWSFENIVNSVTSSDSFLTAGHKHPEMKQKIQEALEKESFDLIHVETFYVMQNVPPTTIPVVLVEHNIEYKVYQRYVDKAAFVLRPLLSIDVSKIKREEKFFWKKATKVAAVSKEDQKVIEQSDIAAVLVSNGVNIDEFAFKAKKPTEEKKLLFIGDFKWIQNRDTVKFIIEKIWPHISYPQARLWIVGRTIPESIKNLSNDPKILFDEKSSSKATPEIFQEADILLSPIRVGGGTSYKILEAMSCGTPVVTMPLSADAIHAKDGQHIMSGKTPEELAKKTIALLEDKQLFAEVARGGRTLIEENYSWKKIAKDLENIYKGVAS
jgi:polysaccharide biosynthesis protein PslH